MHFKVGPVQSRLLDFLLAALEVIRRGHWNFYRYILSYLEEMNEFFIFQNFKMPISSNVTQAISLFVFTNKQGHNTCLRKLWVKTIMSLLTRI